MHMYACMCILYVTVCHVTFPKFDCIMSNQKYPKSKVPIYKLLSQVHQFDWHEVSELMKV